MTSINKSNKAVQPTLNNDNGQHLTLHSNQLQEISEVLMLCNLGDSRFNYKQHQLDYWAAEIQSDFSQGNIDGLKKIIRKGIKGLYSQNKGHITLSVIYSWINEEMKITQKNGVSLPDNWREKHVKLTFDQMQLLTLDQRTWKRQQEM